MKLRRIPLLLCMLVSLKVDTIQYQFEVRSLNTHWELGVRILMWPIANSDTLLYSPAISPPCWCIRPRLEAPSTEAMSFAVEKRVKQGSVLSPALFLLVMDPLQRLRQLACRHLGWVCQWPRFIYICRGISTCGRFENIGNKWWINDAASSDSEEVCWWELSENHCRQMWDCDVLQR